MSPDPERRRMVECEVRVAEQARLFCFMRQIKLKDFVTRAVRDALEPYLPWLESVRKLRPEQ